MAQLLQKYFFIKSYGFYTSYRTNGTRYFKIVCFNVKSSYFSTKNTFKTIIYYNKHTSSKTAKSRVVMFMQSKKQVFFI